MLTKNKLGDSLYLKCLACFFAFVWLIPNHSPPWGTFHNDTLSAFILLVAAVIVFSTPQARQTVWHWPTVAVTACALIPIVQYGFGQILWFGIAWINVAYLLGLACALALGTAWERQVPGQCGDFLFVGIVAAGVLSMVIGLCQWLGLNVSEVWVLKTEERLYANLSQPNQIASLYVLAIVGCAWFYSRKKIGATLAVVLVILLLFGLAMVGSRSGLLNAVFVAAGLLWWSHKSKDKRWMMAATFSLLLLGVWITVFPLLSAWIDIQRPFDWVVKTVLNGRGDLWGLMIDAASKNWLWGYGWGQTSIASLNAAIDHPTLESTTDQSHNLLLDLVIWNGVVIGGLMGVALLAGMAWAAKNIKTIDQLLMFLPLGVLMLHAMTEYPLHYAYFLLPAGMMAGVLTHQMDARIVLTTSRWPIGFMLASAALMLFVTVKDYLRVESSFTELRFEKAGIKVNQIGKPPDVLVLTDLRAAVIMGRWKPTNGMSAQELGTMQTIALTYPSVNNIYTMAVAYGLNGNRESATRWLQIGCKTAREHTCQAMKYEWTHDERLAEIPWPHP